MFIKFDISSCFAVGSDATILANFDGKNEYRNPDRLLVTTTVQGDLYELIDWKTIFHYPEQMTVIKE